MHGWEQVETNTEMAALRFKDGKYTSFENVTKYATPDLAYSVDIERFDAKVAGRETQSPWFCASQASFGVKTALGS